jgi:hypothetical protein
MHAELTTDGGWTAAVPGLAKPIVLDAGDLSPDQNAEFARLVSEARAESGAAQAGAHKAIADGQSYRIVIDVDGNSVRLRAADPAVPPGFSALMEFVKEHGHR